MMQLDSPRHSTQFSVSPRRRAAIPVNGGGAGSPRRTVHAMILIAPALTAVSIRAVRLQDVAFAIDWPSRVGTSPVDQSYASHVAGTASCVFPGWLAPEAVATRHLMFVHANSPHTLLSDCARDNVTNTSSKLASVGCTWA